MAGGFAAARRTCQKIVYIGTMDAKLHAVDADSGKKCEGFATGGVLDINQWNTTNNKWPLSILQPPTVYKDTLFIGWAGKDWAEAEAPPGTVFAVDAQTGRLKWTFDALPPDLAKTTGTSNVWASMSIDPEHGILYLPVSSPSPNFYGGNRKEDLPLATSVTALDADTGKVCGAARSCTTTSGTTTPTRRRCWSISRRTARPFRRWCSRARWASSSCSTG